MINMKNYLYSWAEEKINDNYHQTKYRTLLILITKNYVFPLKIKFFKNKIVRSMAWKLLIEYWKWSFFF
jgi:hypothetical protein